MIVTPDSRFRFAGLACGSALENLPFAARALARHILAIASLRVIAFESHKCRLPALPHCCVNGIF